MRISVRPDHIRRGARHVATCCPVALPIAEAVPRSAPWVYAHEVFLRRGGTAYAIAPPECVSAFVRDFDAGEPVLPFEFDLATGEPAGDRV